MKYIELFEKFTKSEIFENSGEILDIPSDLIFDWCRNKGHEKDPINDLILKEISFKDLDEYLKSNSDNLSEISKSGTYVGFIKNNDGSFQMVYTESLTPSVKFNINFYSPSYKIYDKKEGYYLDDLLKVSKSFRDLRDLGVHKESDDY